jgi:arsenate reductase-like glutaredoxin family protein
MLVREMTDHLVATSSGGPVVVEKDIPLSSSVIWRLQRDFYVQRGLKVWTEDLVPSYITNNPFIAEIYAEIVTGFISDCMNLSQREARPLLPENPLRILELGAGTGKFSYLFLRKLARLLEARKIPPQMVRYSMADCSESLLAEWRANHYLAEFVKAGILEFHLHRAEKDISSAAATNAMMANPTRQATGPLVVIANYVFDSLPQDAFIIAGGEISEALVSTTCVNVDATANEGTPKLSDLRLSFENVPVPPGRYPEKSWNEILEHYRNRLSAATVLFPSATLGLLRQLSQSSDGRMLVLAADKGFVREDDLALLQGPPHLEFHASNNCFSQTVNFDAIARYFYGLGGDWLLPQKHFSSLNICAFIARRPADEFPATRKSYGQALAGFGPDDLFALMSWLNAHLEEVSVVQALAVLRLTRWDTTALLRLFPVIARQLRTVAGERYDLRQAVVDTWANHFPVSPAENLLAFNCGVILLELRFFAEALPFFKASEQVLGRTATTSYNLGLCALGLGRSSDALAYMTEACDLDPGFEPARSSRARLENEQAQS